MNLATTTTTSIYQLVFPDSGGRESLVEVIAVDLGSTQWSHRHTNFVIDHEVREPSTIHENDSLDRSGELVGLRSECRRGDENAFIGALPGKGTIKCLHVGTPNRALPTLRLNVNFFKPELVQRNDPVDTSVPGAADALKVASARPVTHLV